MSFLPFWKDALVETMIEQYNCMAARAAWQLYQAFCAMKNLFSTSNFSWAEPNVT